MDFITQFINFTKEYESPTSFWRWAAYAAVASVLRNNVYFEHGLRRTYPNLYVVLLADSAEYRKSGPPIAISKFLKELKASRVIIGRSSVQAIIDDLSQNVGALKGGSCLLCAEELASFFVNDPALIPLITDMYDFRAEYEYNLKSGKVKINDLCVTMLAASNETFLKEVYTNAAVYGGLLGRTIMVKPDETRPPNSLLEININNYDAKPIMDSLSKIKLLSGQVRITQDAKMIYELWYHALYKSYKRIADRTGVTQRMHTTVLKLAIVIAASHYTLEINEQHMKEAIDEITKLKSNYEVYAMGSGKSTQAEIGALVLNTLWTAPGNKLKREDLLRSHWNMMSAEELDGLVSTLTQAKLLDMEQVNGTGPIYYKMTEKCKDIFMKKEST